MTNTSPLAPFSAMNESQVWRGIHDVCCQRMTLRDQDRCIPQCSLEVITLTERYCSAGERRAEHVANHLLALRKATRTDPRLAVAVGLTPAPYQCGVSPHKPGIRKAGNTGAWHDSCAPGEQPSSIRGHRDDRKDTILGYSIEPGH